MAESRRLLLIVPGLLGPVPDPAALAALTPELSALGRLLSRADCERDEIIGGEATICAAFGLEGPPWPIAAAARAGENVAFDEQAAQRWWLRADPVHLRVDSSNARLFAGYALRLQATETEELVAKLNAHFAADGLRFEAPAPDRWYLGLDRSVELTTHSPAEVAGRNVDAFMPVGEDARAWRTRLNEAQMLLHEAQANRARERAGALPVNSIWLWGGGWTPRPTRVPSHILADDALTRGLARLVTPETAAGREPRVEASPAHAAEWQPTVGTTLAVDWGLRDPLVHGEPEAWLERIQRLEQDWFSSLLDQLQAGAFDELEIRPGDGRRFRISRRGLRRFWRRGRSWSAWLEKGT